MLELGCGYGRLLEPLTAAGHEVTGVDADAGLLGLARERLVQAPQTLIEADITEVSAPGRFERVLIAYNTLYCMDSAEAQREALANAARHLIPGGRIIFDAYAIDGFHHEAPQEDGPEEWLLTVEWRGSEWDVYETCAWSRERQLLDVRYHVRPRGEGDEIVEGIRHRYLLTDQVEALCESAGLRALHVCGDFRGRALDEDSEHLVCIATVE